MLTLTDEVISFLRDFADESDYYPALAARVARHLPPKAGVCDLGCGIGGLSLSLAPYCATLTAVDNNSRAIAALYSRQLEQGVKNVSPLCDDAFGIHGDFDVLIACSFGTAEKLVTVAERMAPVTLIIIKRKRAGHRFCVNSVVTGDDTPQRAELYLSEHGLPYEKESFSLDMGQPFRSIADAERFFRLYGTDEHRIKDRLAQLVQRHDTEYRYFYPAPAELSMFIVRFPHR